jgi:hypothetical protein
MSRSFLVLLSVLALAAAGAGYLRFGLIPKWNEEMYQQQLAAEEEERRQKELSEALAQEEEDLLTAIYIEAYATESATASASVSGNIK